MDAVIQGVIDAVGESFGLGGVIVVLLVIGAFCLMWYWQTRSSDGARAVVRDSGNSSSTATGGQGGAGGQGGTGTGGSQP